MGTEVKRKVHYKHYYNDEKTMSHSIIEWVSRRLLSTHTPTKLIKSEYM